MKTLLALILLPLVAHAADEAPSSSFVGELTIGLGGTLHQKNDLNEHHGQGDLSIAVSIVRERTRSEGKAYGVMGGIIGYRSLFDFSGGNDHWSRADEIYFGPVLHLWGCPTQEVRFGGGPDVITATRKRGPAYVTETAIGGWIELQYYYRLQHTELPSTAFGAALGVEGADVGYAGSRVPVGGYHLSLLISSDF